MARLQKELKTDAQKVVRDAIRAGEREAKKMSSGGYSLSTLAAMDHPYAERHGPFGSGALDPAKINKQSGEFYQHWGTDLPQSGDRVAVGRLFNNDAKADLLKFGTQTMVARPIDQHLELYIFDAATYGLQRAALALERIYG